MRQAGWRWLFGLGVLATAGALLGQAGVAAASPAVAARAARSASAGAAASASGRASASGAASAQYVPPGKVLTLGMHGTAVKNMQKRLAALKYYPGAIDGQFGMDTLEAVWAFKEVQGYPINFANQDVVSLATERALVHPRAPKVLVRRGGSMRIEVNMGNETLVLYKKNKVALVSHVSTGVGCYNPNSCGWITPTGNYKALGYSPGWLQVPLGEMYNSVWFIGETFAIHGEYDSAVPFYPYSHGCVRIPFDIANFFHTLIKIPGTPIYIRN